ncbi:MAG: fumarylacetoacetate hydrolase family protein [Burkholderiaceae bacterium]
MDIEIAAQSIWHEMQRKRHLPPEWRGRLSVPQAYAAQLAILRRWVQAGDTQAGWKVGLTSAAMRLQQGVSEPCFGFLLDSGHLQSGVHLKYDDLIAPAFENELCLTLGEALRGPGVTFEMARGAVAAMEPAFEIIEARGDFRADMALSLTDNAQHKAFVTGALVACNGQEAFDATQVQVLINGVERARAQGTEVMGNPVHSIVWLANKLSEYGVVLERDMRIMTGSFTGQFALARGDKVQSCFEPLGAVAAAFY